MKKLSPEEYKVEISYMSDSECLSEGLWQYFQHACAAGNLVAMRRAIETGIDINSDRGSWCLFQAVKHRQQEAVLFLIKKGVKIGTERRHCIKTATDNQDFIMLVYLTTFGSMPDAIPNTLEANKKAIEWICSCVNKLNQYFYDRYIDASLAMCLACVYGILYAVRLWGTVLLRAITDSP